MKIMRPNVAVNQGVQFSILIKCLLVALVILCLFLTYLSQVLQHHCLHNTVKVILKEYFYFHFFHHYHSHPHHQIAIASTSNVTTITVTVITITIFRYRRTVTVLLLPYYRYHIIVTVLPLPYYRYRVLPLPCFTVTVFFGYF